MPPFLEDAYNRARTFHPAAGTAALAVVAPLIADRDYRLECAFTWREEDDGVIFALGDAIAGMALFARQGTVSFVYNGGRGHPVVCECLPCRPGLNRFELQHHAAGERRGQGTIAIDGRTATTLDMSPTTILGLGVGESLDIGRDRKLHVTPLYGREGPCPYTGTVEYVRIEPGAHPSDSYANRQEWASQRD
jgi:arylsulfatase